MKFKPESQIRLNNTIMYKLFFDKLSNVQAIYRYRMKKTAQLPLEQQAKWFSELKKTKLTME